MRKNDFGHELIKGKIAEIIFELMFRESGKFSVFRFGYEYTEEYLAQHRLKTKFPQVINNISDSPDFLLITEDKSQVYLVEVKYSSRLFKQDMVKIADKLNKRWEPAYLFVVSKDGFYFDPANTIINRKGEIKKLSEKWISQGIQNINFALAKEFLLDHKHQSKPSG